MSYLSNQTTTTCIDTLSLHDALPILPAEGVSLKEVTAAYERQWIESALEAAGGVQKRAAELLRIKPTTLNEMIKRYDIRPRRKKASSGTNEPEHNGSENGDELEPVGEAD